MTEFNPAYVLDARYMEPPEPFVKTFDLLKVLPEGERMLLLLFREPHPLYRVLKQDGFRYETRLQDDGTFEILIGR